MLNKEIKVGSKIWLNTACLARDSYYVVSSVKKEKTLVTVVVDVPENYCYKAYQITMYGHASSRILSGYDRRFGHNDITYTCDYSLVQEKTDRYDYENNLKDAGRALLKIAKYFK